MRKTLRYAAVVLAFSWAPPLIAEDDRLDEQPPRQEIAFELTDADREILLARIDHIMDKDQQFRSYLSFETTDDEKIARLSQLDAKAQLQAMAECKGRLSAEIKSLLQQLQLKNDMENRRELVEIIKQYGYPSPARLGTKGDRLFTLLLHPPVKLEQVEANTEAMCELLLPEVRAGRMPARYYAMFVDNMRAKILRQPQLYGTNQSYDPESKTILPPQIEDLELANQARREIGLPELKSGEYRLAAN